MKFTRINLITLLIFISICSYGNIFVENGQNPNFNLISPISSADLEFDLSNSIGLLVKQNDVSASNLKKITSSGVIEDTCTIGSVYVNGLFNGPNNKTYLFFSSMVNINGSQYCLAELSRDTNVLTGIENETTSIMWDYGGWNPSAPIQFDSEGAIYYVGSSSNGNKLIRKYLNGTVTSVLDQGNIEINQFLVMDDGDIYFSGHTISTSVHWLRKLTPTHQLSNIFVEINVQWIDKFPNNQIYLAIWGGNSGYGGIYYIQENDTIDSRPWISGSNCNNIQYYPYNCLEKILTDTSGYWLCDAEDLIFMENGSVVGYSGQNGLVQYYPKALAIKTSLKTINKIAPAYGNNIFISGTDLINQNKTILYNLDTRSETLIFNNIYAYQLSVQLGPTNKYLFIHGYDFANDKMKIGIYDFQTQLVNTVDLNFTDPLRTLQGFFWRYFPYCNIGIIDYCQSTVTSTSGSSSGSGSSDQSGSSSSDQTTFPEFDYNENVFDAIDGTPFYYTILVGMTLTILLIQKKVKNIEFIKAYGGNFK